MGGTGFTIQWPSAARPATITTPYDSETGTVSIAAPTGTAIQAGAAGKVSMVTSNSVQVSAGTFTITYSNLQNIKVHAGETVTTDTPIGESAGGESIQVMLQQAIDPTALLVQPPATQPTTPTQPGTPQTGGSKKLYVTPTSSGVRIREKPVDGKPLGQVNTIDVLEVIEPAEAARAKIGVEGQWLNVRTMNGLEGYSAAQFYKLYDGPEPTKPTTNILGMNLDMYNRLGRPTPDRMKGIGWIRVKYNVSYNPDKGTYGNTDVNATFNRMKPFLQPYVNAGIKVIVVFTHQLYGEGAGYDWTKMDTNRWNDLIPKYADFARRAAQLLSSAGLVHCYQVWNEQDTPPAVARAAVPVPAKDYANLLAQTIRAIRSVDKTTPIITGGHCTGPDSAGAYARATLAAMPGDVRPDGIASHPYGRGVKGHPFSNFGGLDEEIRKTSTILPGKPIWITEWGVLDRQNNLSVAAQVADYASGFIGMIKSQFPTNVAAAVWYAWADGMDNGYGLVDKDDKPKNALYEKFLKL